MSAPILTAVVRVLGAQGGEVTVGKSGEATASIAATPDQIRAYADLLLSRAAVRITIEPADAPEEPPAHGSALDYLSQMKTALSGLADAHDSQTDDANHRVIRRCMSLANSASLAILAAQRGGT